MSHLRYAKLYFNIHTLRLLFAVCLLRSAALVHLPENIRQHFPIQPRLPLFHQGDKFKERKRGSFARGSGYKFFVARHCWYDRKMFYSPTKRGAHVHLQYCNNFNATSVNSNNAKFLRKFLSIKLFLFLINLAISIATYYNFPRNSYLEDI